MSGQKCKRKVYFNNFFTAAQTEKIQNTYNSFRQWGTRLAIRNPGVLVGEFRTGDSSKNIYILKT